MTFAGTEFTPGTLFNGDTVTSVTLTSAGAAATATVAGSPYTIVPSAAVGTGLANYSISYTNGSLTVNQAALTVTANSSAKTYGQTVTFAGTEFTPGTLFNGDTVTSVTLTSSGAAVTAVVAGSPYTIVPSAAVGTGLANYSISYVTGTLTVNQAPLTITATSTSKTYGATFAGSAFTTSTLLNGDTVTSVTLIGPGNAPTATVAGSPYVLTPSAAVGTGVGNYSISYVNGTLTVTPAALTVTASARSKTYGQAVTFAGTEFTTSGLANSDTVTSATLTSAGAAATATVAGSPYTIVPSAAVGTGLANYSLSYVNGSLTVNTATLTITASARSKAYGQAVTFAGTEFTTAGLVNSDTVTSVTLTSAGAASGATVAGSPYPIVPGAAVGTGLTNYTIGYVNGALTVTTNTLTVTANSTSTLAGTALPPLTATITGFVNGDTSAVVSGAASLSTTATVASPPGSYPITVSLGTLSAANYTFAFVNGTLTLISPAPQPALISVVSGNGQSGLPGTPLPVPLVAIVTSAQGTPITNTQVSFTISGAQGLSAFRFRTPVRMERSRQR